VVSIEGTLSMALFDMIKTSVRVASGLLHAPESDVPGFVEQRAARCDFVEFG